MIQIKSTFLETQFTVDKSANVDSRYVSFECEKFS